MTTKRASGGFYGRGWLLPWRGARDNVTDMEWTVLAAFARPDTPPVTSVADVIRVCGLTYDRYAPLERGVRRVVQTLLSRGFLGSEYVGTRRRIYKVTADGRAELARREARVMGWKETT